jgi:hypothetical protein
VSILFSAKTNKYILPDFCVFCGFGNVPKSNELLKKSATEDVKRKGYCMAVVALLDCAYMLSCASVSSQDSSVSRSPIAHYGGVSCQNLQDDKRSLGTRPWTRSNSYNSRRRPPNRSWTLRSKSNLRYAKTQPPPRKKMLRQCSQENFYPPPPPNLNFSMLANR